MRRAAAIALVALIALSGCSLLPGGPASDAANTTGTPGGVNGSGDDAGTHTGEFTYPDGYAPSGIADSQAALESHTVGLLAAESFIFRFNGTAVSNGSTISVSVLQAANASSNNAYVITEISGFGSRTRYYSNDTVFVRTDPPGENNTNYSSSQVNYSLSQFTGRDAVGPLLRYVEYGDGEILRRENDTFVRYRANRLTNVPAVLGDRVSPENVTEFRAAILVDDEGIVHRLAYQATIERGNRTLQVDLRLNVLGTGSTTVEDPDWIERAR